MDAPGLDLALVDAAKLAEITSAGLDRMDPVKMAILEERVAGEGGFMYVLHVNDEDDTVSVIVGGFTVARVPRVDLLRRPRGDA